MACTYCARAKADGSGHRIWLMLPRIWRTDSPFFGNMANMAKRLQQGVANGLVLFNRFYQPDIDLEDLEVKPNVLLSTPQSLRLPLTWIGILFERVKIHAAEDVLKMLMVGADLTMPCSALFRNGIHS